MVNILTDGSYLSVYELSRLLGSRATQISKGANILVDDVALDKNGLVDPIETAKRELKENVMPLNIRRNRIDGRIEILNPNNMKITPKISILN